LLQIKIKWQSNYLTTKKKNKQVNITDHSFYPTLSPPYLK